MKVNKVQQLAMQLQDFIDNVDPVFVKDSVGNSVRNNRTLTSSQVIRFLLSSPDRKDRKLGKTLLAAYRTFAVRDILRSQRAFVRRTDSFDVKEFLVAINLLSYSTSAVRSLSQVISKAV